MPAAAEQTPPSPTGHEGHGHAWSPHRVVGTQRLPGAGDGTGDRRRWHLRAGEHAAGRTAGPVGRAGDRVHRVPGAGAPGGRGPGDLDRKSVVEGKSVSVRVEIGGRRPIKKKKTKNHQK